MDKKDCKAALFDVDGTIVNGNCTQIFIQYLCDENILKNIETLRYNRLIKNHLSHENNSLAIASEAFSILSCFDSKTLLEKWDLCQETRIKNKFNELIIREIKFFQESGIEIFLASGSPDLLIKGIAVTLDIPKGNVVATKLKTNKCNATVDIPVEYCIGYGKELAVLELFKKRKIQINRVCIYSDNFSDFNLLCKAGKGYWVGSRRAFEAESMVDHGIEYFFQNCNNSRKENFYTGLLEEYHMEKASIIEKSVCTTFPPVCDQGTMDKLVGSGHTDWDFATLQKAYFDPVNEYLERHGSRLVTLGTCIFLEAGGIKLDDCISLLALGEMLNISNEVFVDITNWTSGNNMYKSEKSHVEISVYGNASISLLSLPLHNVLHNRTSLDSTMKMKLYELFTSMIHYSLFGNGTKLYWQQQNENHISIDEYMHVAMLLNKGFFQSGMGLFLILSEKDMDESLQEVFRSFSENSAILIQLLKDQMAYDNWKNGRPFDKKNRFELFANLIPIHACRKTDDPKLFKRNQVKGELESIITATNSVDFLDEKIKYYQRKADQAIELMPYDESFRLLINSYVSQLARL